MGTRRSGGQGGKSTEPEHDPAVQLLWDQAVLSAQKDMADFADLLQMDIYFLGSLQANLPQDEFTSIDAKTQISVTHWQDEQGNMFVPCFSSLELMNKQVGNIQPYMSLNGRDFFEMTLGEVLVLDPDTPNELALSSEEISCLLARYC
jgi:hypothetical protein